MPARPTGRRTARIMLDRRLQNHAANPTGRTKRMGNNKNGLVSMSSTRTNTPVTAWGNGKAKTVSSCWENVRFTVRSGKRDKHRPFRCLPRFQQLCLRRVQRDVFQCHMNAGSASRHIRRDKHIFGEDRVTRYQPHGLPDAADVTATQGRAGSGRLTSG